MKMYIKQPNGWSCFPTAVSILTDIPLEDLLKEIGHDGAVIVDDQKPDPWCREAFLHEEMVIALHRFCWTISLIHAAITPARTNYPEFERIKRMIDRWNCPTVVTVQKPQGLHCIAWDVPEDRVIDPMTGTDYDGQYPVLTVEPLFRI